MILELLQKNNFEMKIRRKPSKKKNKNLLRKEQSKKVYKR